MGDFLKVFPSKPNLEPTEPLVCPQKPNLEPAKPPKTERNQVRPNTTMNNDKSAFILFHLTYFQNIRPKFKKFTLNCFATYICILINNELCLFS